MSRGAAPIIIHSECGNAAVHVQQVRAGLVILSTVRGSKKTEGVSVNRAELVAALQSLGDRVVHVLTFLAVWFVAGSLAAPLFGKFIAAGNRRS